jgi:hypothetical protein
MTGIDLRRSNQKETVLGIIVRSMFRTLMSSQKFDIETYEQVDFSRSPTSTLLPASCPNKELSFMSLSTGRRVLEGKSLEKIFVVQNRYPARSIIKKASTRVYWHIDYERLSNDSTMRLQDDKISRQVVFISRLCSWWLLSPYVFNAKPYDRQVDSWDRSISAAPITTGGH